MSRVRASSPAPAGGPLAVLLAVLITVLIGVLPGCSSSADRPAFAHLAGGFDYLPGRAAQLFLPHVTHGAPVIVLVPGGGWRTADPAGLRPLADRLAASGLITLTVTYRTADRRAFFPAPAEDVACAVDVAVARVREVGLVPGPVFVAGHSAGAQLALLVALSGPRFDAGCPAPHVAVAGAVGLAGPYDIAAFADVAQSLIGAPPERAPAAWSAANPVTWAGERPDLPVLLAHGTADTTVAPSFTTTFAATLRAGGHPVTVDLVRGADHAAIYRADTIAARIAGWVRQVCARR